MYVLTVNDNHFPAHVLMYKSKNLTRESGIKAVEADALLYHVYSI